MGVYVDNMRANFGRMVMCHMLADTCEELHAMAERIHLRRDWFQGNHYDVSLSRKAEAIKLGAIEIDMHETAALTIAWRDRYGGVR